MLKLNLPNNLLKDRFTLLEFLKINLNSIHYLNTIQNPVACYPGHECHNFFSFTVDKKIIRTNMDKYFTIYILKKKKENKQNNLM